MVEVRDDRLYTKSHEWVKVEGDVATVGLTAYATEELGDITFVEVKPVGSKVSKGEPLGIVESSKTTEKIYTPLSGEIVEINKEVGVLEEGSTEIPIGLEAITEDPYEKGWIVRIKIENRDEMKDLLSPEEYKKLLEESSG